MNKTILLISIIFSGLTLTCQPASNEEIQTLFLSEKYSQVIEYAHKKLKDDFSNHVIQYYLALAYRENYQFEKSIKTCTEILKHNATNKETQKLLAKNYLSLNLYDEAYKIYFDLSRKDTSSIQIKIQLAKLSQKLDKNDLAIDLYKELIAYDSLNSYFYKQLGLCYLKLNDTSALRILEQAVQLNPGDLSLAIKLANKYNDKKYYFNALAVLDFVTPYNKDKFQLYKAKAYTLFLIKENKRAAKNFNKVLQLGDTTRFTLKYLGYAYFEMGNYEDAYKTLKEVFKYDTTDTRVYFHLSIAARKLYKIDESVLFMKKSFKYLLPNKRTMALYYNQAAENYITYGARMKIKGDFESERQSYYSAIQNFEFAFQADSIDKRSLYLIATTYDNYLNERTKALAYYLEYKKTLKRYPEETDQQYTLRTQHTLSRIQKIREELHFEGTLDQ